MAAIPSLLPGHLGETALHGQSRIVHDAPLRVVTDAIQWSYALSCAPSPDGGEQQPLRDARVLVELDVLRGSVGVGWTNPAGDAYLEEKFSSSAGALIVLSASSRGEVGRLVIRNVDGAGPSEFLVRGVRLEPVNRHARAYPVQLAARELASERTPDDGGSAIVFDTDAAHAINSARRAWLESAGLPLGEGRVLDIGCGVGHFLGFYLERGCTIVAVDGRPENIAELRSRHPGLEAHVADAQEIQPERLGTFDVIHSFGLLYHLDSPVMALRKFRAMTRGVLVLETMVCDSSSPVAVLADETKSASQALDGLGSRPSPAFVALALNRAGFRYVYGASSPPAHPDFEFSWLDNLDTTRDGHALRCVFVASDARLELPSLVPLVE